MHSTVDSGAALAPGLVRRLGAFAASVLVFMVLLTGDHREPAPSVVESLPFADLVLDGADRVRSRVDDLGVSLQFSSVGVSSDVLVGQAVAAVEADGWSLSEESPGVFSGLRVVDGRQVRVLVQSAVSDGRVTVELAVDSN